MRTGCYKTKQVLSLKTTPWTTFPNQVESCRELAWRSRRCVANGAIRILFDPRLLLAKSCANPVLPRGHALHESAGFLWTEIPVSSDLPAELKERQSSLSYNFRKPPLSPEVKEFSMRRKWSCFWRSSSQDMSKEKMSTMDTGKEQEFSASHKAGPWSRKE